MPFFNPQMASFFSVSHQISLLLDGFIILLYTTLPFTIVAPSAPDRHKNLLKSAILKIIGEIEKKGLKTAQRFAQ